MRGEKEINKYINKSEREKCINKSVSERERLGGQHQVDRCEKINIPGNFHAINVATAFEQLVN